VVWRDASRTDDDVLWFYVPVDDWWFLGMQVHQSIGHLFCPYERLGLWQWTAGLVEFIL
jgi:hypothetical protein